jgi:hypothetical protein
MDKLNKQAYIAAKKDEKEHYQRIWQSIVELNEQLAFSIDCYRELQARIYSKVEQSRAKSHNAKGQYFNYE